MSESLTPRLSSATFDVRARPPARIAHFGLGAFHRAHQAWFTAHASDADQWGICAFSGRRGGLYETLRAQDGLYTLVERSSRDDQFEVITNLVETYNGADGAALVEVISRPAITVITTTITEAGYRMDSDGAPRMNDPELASDVQLLRTQTPASRLDKIHVTTVPGRILLGLEARRRAGVGPLAIVPCDNLSHNGRAFERGLTQLANEINPSLATWIGENVSFVSTSVDRITPRTTQRDIESVRSATGWYDGAPVITEPFASWVMSGNFPAGRPDWESAGAVFVEDIEPYERRKLWLLNAGHSLLAYHGIEAGHRSVADAMADEYCRGRLESFWKSASTYVATDLDATSYCDQLATRFTNSRVNYHLDQIASDSLAKLRARVAPIVVAAFGADREFPAGEEVVAAWIRLVLSRGSFPDAEIDSVSSVLRDRTSCVRALIALVDTRLGNNHAFVAHVKQLVQRAGQTGVTFANETTNDGRV